MFSTAGIRVSRGLRHGEPRRIGLHHFSSTLRTSSQKPYRKGVVFTTVSGLILVSGVMITVLGKSHTVSLPEKGNTQWQIQLHCLISFVYSSIQHGTSLTLF